VTGTRSADVIRGYHAHVYYDSSTRDVAVALREALVARFDVELGQLFDAPHGPHTQPMYQVTFDAGGVAAIVPWLMLNRRGLSILVHPRTDDVIADHLEYPLWLGTPIPFDDVFVRNFVASRQETPVP
jgi:aromatic ring-cleaving dioxygenase